MMAAASKAAAARVMEVEGMTEEETGGGKGGDVQGGESRSRFYSRKQEPGELTEEFRFLILIAAANVTCMQQIL